MNGKQIIKLLQAQGFQLLRINGRPHILGNGSCKVTPSPFMAQAMSRLARWVASKTIRCEVEMRAVKFAAIFEPQPEGGYTITFPDIPEAISEGDTKDECLLNAQEVLTLCLEQRMDDGETIPDASTVKGGSWIEPSAAMQAAVLVRAWRTKQGKTVSEIARTLNTSWAAAQKLENHRANPTLRQLERTAAALGKRLHVEMV